MGLGRLAPSLPAFLFKGNFLPHGDKKNSSATHTKDFCEKNFAKVARF
jgi:hypothetical protein